MSDGDRKSGAKSAEDGEKLPFTSHLEELRNRVIRCGIALIVCFALCYNFSQYLFDFFTMPLLAALPEGSTMAMIRVQEGFLTHLKIALLAALFLACPVIFFQLWKFVAPGLYPKEKKYVWPFVITATIFFLAGAAFAFYVVFPFGFQFLLGYAGNMIQASISMEGYLAFATRLLLAFGIVFELPVVVFFLVKMGLLTYHPLARGRGYALVIIVIVAAILTPPDVFTQTLMACPLYLLYEVSIIVAKVFGPKEEKEAEAEAEV